MRLTIFDSEYLSISRRYSDFKSLIKFKKKLFPEIIQISFLEISNIFSKKNKKKKLNIFIKTNQKITSRISRLTGISQKIIEEKGYLFQDAISLIDKFNKKKSILVANGDDIKLIKLNINYNDINRKKKNTIYYVNLKSLLNKIYNSKNFDTQTLNKIFNFKINFRIHDSSNDCKIIYRSLKKLIKIYGKKKFKKIIDKNKKLIYY